MKKYIWTAITLAFLVTTGFCQDEILEYLKFRKDKLAWEESEKILRQEPQNTLALWVKAEVLRRTYRFKESEKLLNQILSQDPNHISSLISLSYIRYHDGKFEKALKILQKVLKQPRLDKQNEALAYMILGAINSRRSKKGWLLGKIIYGTRIKSYFLKAKELAPDLPEVHLGLGTFYLLAPAIAGGNLDKALQELELAVKIAPDFATPCARLAQVYKKTGDLEKYNFYWQKAKDLDPQNEVLYEEFRDSHDIP